MESKFSAEFFKGNREKLRSLFTGKAPIVLTANGLMQRGSDSAYPFRQDASFWYLTGIDEPDVIFVIDKSKEYIIVPDLSTSRIAFDGDVNIDKINQLKGDAEVLNEKEGWRRLGNRLKKSSNVAVLSPKPVYMDRIGIYSNPARRHLIVRMKKENPNLTLLDLSQHLARLRMVKQDAEIDAIEKAVDITVNGIKQIHKKYLKHLYANEFEIENELNKHFRLNGGTGHSFDPIVASGRKGLTLHPSGSYADIGKFDQLLLDVGAEYDHYAADITRTWPIKPTKRFNAVYTAVLEVSNYALGLLIPAVTLQDYEKEVELFMGEKLRELGLIKAIDHDSVRQFFPHSTSHFLGIDVHDAGGYGIPLVAGVVLTVEPGIYIPQEGIAIRIEDDVLITATGNRVLSEKLDK